MAKQNESILDSIKKQLGIVPEYTVFDDQHKPFLSSYPCSE